MGISLKRLEKRKLDLGIDKLWNAGIDVDQWLAMCNADAVAMQRLAEAWPVRLGQIDAETVCRIFGFPCNCTEQPPKAGAGEIVVWYGGWTLGELCATGKVRNHLHPSTGAWKTPAGYYHIRIVIDNNRWVTSRGHMVDQLAQLYPDFKELPTPVGATALAAHFSINGRDLLYGNFCHCAEGDTTGLRVYRECVEVTSDRGFTHFKECVLGAARKA